MKRGDYSIFIQDEERARLSLTESRTDVDIKASAIGHKQSRGKEIGDPCINVRKDVMESIP